MCSITPEADKSHYDHGGHRSVGRAQRCRTRHPTGLEKAPRQSGAAKYSSRPASIVVPQNKIGSDGIIRPVNLALDLTMRKFKPSHYPTFRSADGGQLAGGNVFEIAQPFEQALGRDAGAAGIEAGTELVEQFGIAQRQLGMAAGAAHLLALDPLAVAQLDDDLVVNRGAADLDIVILVRHDRDAADQFLY